MCSIHPIHRALVPAALAGLGLAAHGQLTISEVFVDPVGVDVGHQVIELYNASAEPIELQSYLVCIAGTMPQTHGCIFPLPELVLPGLSFSRVHWAADGEDDPFDVHTGVGFDAIPHPIGSVGLIDAETGIYRDYVQWGGDCFPVPRAHLVGQWVAGTWVDTPLEGHTIAFDGAGDTFDDWFEDLSPTLGFLNTLPGNPTEFVYGKACAGSLGEMGIGGGFGPPALGNLSYEIRVTNALPGAIAALGMSPGEANIHLFGCVVQIDFGQPGFMLFADQMVSSAMVAAFPAPVPDAVSLIGLDVFLQGGVIDPLAPAGIAFTRGLEITF